MGKTDLGFETEIFIGATAGSLEAVKIEPHVEFSISGEVERVVCGKSKATGYPRCRWTYPDRLLSGEQYYQLQSLVGNEASANVYIVTPTNEISITTYEPIHTTYQAIMNWPAEGVRRVHHNLWEIEDGILFTNLEPV